MSQTNVLKHPFKTDHIPSQQAEGDTKYYLYQATAVEPINLCVITCHPKHSNSIRRSIWYRNFFLNINVRNRYLFQNTEITLCQTRIHELCPWSILYFFSEPSNLLIEMFVTVAKIDFENFYWYSFVISNLQPRRLSDCTPQNPKWNGGLSYYPSVPWNIHVANSKKCSSL